MNTYVYLMENVNPLNEAIITQHVAYLKMLKQSEKLILCGPFIDYPGGMVVFLSNDKEEATAIAKADPLIASGCKMFVLRTLEVAEEENNYLL